MRSVFNPLAEYAPKSKSPQTSGMGNGFYMKGKFSPAPEKLEAGTAG
jgi:hypothetical protein